MSQRPIHIKHPDLTKMSDSQLAKEATYWLRYGKNICMQIQHGFEIIEFDPKPMIEKTIEDLQLAADRYAAIVDEMKFRNESMR